VFAHVLNEAHAHRQRSADIFKINFLNPFNSIVLSTRSAPK